MQKVTIIDTVTLEGLEVGTQYKLVGWQMLKEENAELLIDGKRVESDYTFTADSETMKVEVILACLLLTCKNTDSQGCVSIDFTLYYRWDCWYFPNRQNKKSQSIYQK